MKSPKVNIFLTLSTLSFALFDVPGLEIQSASAATFSSSSGRVVIDQFSHQPLFVSTLAEANTFALATDGSVTAIADADAIASSNPPFAFNSSFAEAFGDGLEYLGVARSEAAVIVRNFSVEADETFSFNFNAFLELETQIDTAPHETANTSGNIALFLFDDHRPETPFEFLNISGGLNTEGYEDFLKVKSSGSFNLNQHLDSSFGGLEEFALAEVLGDFSYTFDEAVNLTLMEVKTNQVTVKAKVPEPSSTIALLLLSSFGGAIALKKTSHKLPQ